METQTICPFEQETLINGDKLKPENKQKDSKDSLDGIFYFNFQLAIWMIKRLLVRGWNKNDEVNEKIPTKSRRHAFDGKKKHTINKQTNNKTFCCFQLQRNSIWWRMRRNESRTRWDVIWKQCSAVLLARWWTHWECFCKTNREWSLTKGSLGRLSSFQACDTSCSRTISFACFQV